MAEEKFIWCRNCDAVHHVSCFDKAPVYIFSEGAVEEQLADDWRQFMMRHEGHRLEPLRTIGAKYFPRGTIADPMSIGYVEVTNGSDRLLLRQSRDRIDEPLRFNLVTGRLMDHGLSLTVQEREIKKEMTRHFKWPGGKPPSDKTIKLFIGLFKDVVADLNLAQVEVAGYSYTDDNVAYGLLDTITIDKLVAKCADSFNPEEFQGLCAFIRSHLDGCDVMSVVMRRHMAVEPVASSQSAVRSIL